MSRGSGLVQHPDQSLGVGREGPRAPQCAVSSVGAAWGGRDGCGGGWRGVGTPPAALRDVCGAESGGSLDETILRLGENNLRPRETAPTLTMDSGPTDPLSGWFTVYFRFSGDVVNFDIHRLFVPGGSLVPGTVVQISMSEYQVRIAPYSNAFEEGVGKVDITAFPFDVQDAAGIERVTFKFSRDNPAGPLATNWASISDDLRGQSP